MMEMSAVKSLFGLIILDTNNFPLRKSFVSRRTAYSSLREEAVVICARIKSSPVRFATTRAGRFRDELRSEKGKRRTTTSPLTGISMLHPLPLLTNPLLKIFHWLKLETFFH